MVEGNTWRENPNYINLHFAIEFRQLDLNGTLTFLHEWFRYGMYVNF